jgi:hypothetical protein
MSHILLTGRSTWWRWISIGEDLKETKVNQKTTAWRTSQIRNLLDVIGKEGIYPGLKIHQWAKRKEARYLHISREDDSCLRDKCIGGKA